MRFNLLIIDSVADNLISIFVSVNNVLTGTGFAKVVDST